MPELIHGVTQCKRHLFFVIPREFLIIGAYYLVFKLILCKNYNTNPVLILILGCLLKNRLLRILRNCSMLYS